jgi:hypothetical protein
MFYLSREASISHILAYTYTVASIQKHYACMHSCLFNPRVIHVKKVGLWKIHGRYVHRVILEISWLSHAETGIHTSSTLHLYVDASIQAPRTHITKAHVEPFQYTFPQGHAYT